MGQYSLVVADADDLSEFDLLNDANADNRFVFIDDGGTPSVEYKNLNAVAAAAVLNGVSASTQVDYYVFGRHETPGSGRANGMTPMANDASGYYFRIRIDGVYEAGYYTDSGFTVLETTAGELARTTPKWHRITVDGTQLKVKLWTGALADEPGGIQSDTDWDIVTTDTGDNVSAGGRPGLWSYNTTFSGQWARGSQFYVGTGGDPAPVGDPPAGPVLTNPVGTADGDDYTGSVDTDTDTGTLYHLAVLDSASDPTVSEIKAGTDQAVSATGTQNVSGGPLDPGVYRLWFVHNDGTDDSAVVSSATFEIEEPAAAIGWSVDPAIDGVTVNSITVKATPDQTADVYAVAIPAGATAPSQQQVIDGQDSTGTAAEGAGSDLNVTGEATITLTGLTAHPSYKVCVVAEVPE